MKLVDRAARRTAVVDDRPCRVWLPAQRTAAPAGRTPAAATPRAPRSFVVSLTRRQAVDLPIWLPGLLAMHDVRPGDRVTVDLADLGSVHLTGLELLMTVLWRRVATHGEVLLTGGTAGLRAQLKSLDLTPATCRAAVYGPPPAPAVAPGPVPAVIPTGMGSRAGRHGPAPPQARLAGRGGATSPDHVMVQPQKTRGTTPCRGDSSAEILGIPSQASSAAVDQA